MGGGLRGPPPSGIGDCSKTHVYNDLKVFDFLTYQVCKYAGMRVCKYTSTQVLPYAYMQVCKYVSMQLFNYSSKEWRMWHEK